MNLRFTITAVVAAAAISLFAQNPPAGQRGGPGAAGPRGQGGGMMRGMRMSEEMKKELKITPAQEKKLQAIRDKYAKLLQNMQKEMEAVYTPEQKKILEKRRAEMMRGFGGGRPGGATGGNRSGGTGAGRTGGGTGRAGGG